MIGSIIRIFEERVALVTAVSLDCFFWIAGKLDLPVVQPDDPLAHLSDRRHRMGNDQDRSAHLLEGMDAVGTFLLESLIPDA